MSIYSRHIFIYIQQAAILLLWNIAAFVLIYQNLSHQGAFKNGVVSALLLRRAIDFTGFLGTFQDTAVVDKKNFNDVRISAYMQMFLLHHNYYFIAYLVPLPLPSIFTTPFLPICFSNCVVFDFPNST